MPQPIQPNLRPTQAPRGWQPQVAWQLVLVLKLIPVREQRQAWVQAAWPPQQQLVALGLELTPQRLELTQAQAP